LYLERARLSFLDVLPIVLSVEIRPLSSSQFTLLQVYTTDGSCDLGDSLCADLNEIILDTPEGVGNILDIPLNFNEVIYFNGSFVKTHRFFMLQPVGSVRVVAMGFEQSLPFEVSL